VEPADVAAALRRHRRQLPRELLERLAAADAVERQSRLLAGGLLVTPAVVAEGDE
jgi:hypothetical protein